MGQRLDVVEDLPHNVAEMAISHAEENRQVARELNQTAEMFMDSDMTTVLTQVRDLWYNRRPAFGPHPDGALRMIAWKALHNALASIIRDGCGEERLHRIPTKNGKVMNSQGHPMYEQAIIPSQMLVLSTLIAAVSGPLGIMIQSINKEKLILVLNTSLLIVTILLCLLLIPFFGIIGVASAVVATQVVRSTVLLVMERRYRHQLYSQDGTDVG